MFMNDSPSYSVSERVPFQALWVEFHPNELMKLTLPEEALERYNNDGKPTYMMDDFNITSLTNETCNFSKGILISL